jgi:hypothetical protein
MNWRDAVRSLKQSAIAIVLALIVLSVILAITFQIFRAIFIHNTGGAF